MRKSVSTLWITILLLTAGSVAGEPVPLAYDGIHDPTNHSLYLLQEPSEALASLPRSDKGVIDWIGALDTGVINPRTGLTGTEKMVSIDLDIVMPNTSTMPNVRFRHLTHTQWLTCKNCHTKIFMPQKGANLITMAAIIEGRACGTCHGKVAFSPLNCARCHSITNTSGSLR